MQFACGNDKVVRNGALQFAFGNDKAAWNEALQFACGNDKAAWNGALQFACGNDKASYFRMHTVLMLWHTVLVLRRSVRCAYFPQGRFEGR